MIGKIAIAMAGHDKGHAYIIIKEEDGFVYLVDGENRKLDDAGEPGRYDHELKRTLKLFWQHMNNAEV